MVHAGSRWPVTAKVSVHSQTSLCEIFGVQNGIATGSFASTGLFAVSIVRQMLHTH